MESEKPPHEPGEIAGPRKQGIMADEHVPDPDEADLDDLDDILDEFSATKLDKDKATLELPEIKTNNGKLKEAPVDIEKDLGEDEFAKQLQDQMAALMGNIDESPEMKREIEAMLQQLNNADDVGAATGANSSSREAASVKNGIPSSEALFQETIRKTIKRMQASGDQASAAEKADESDDFLAKMMKGFQSGGADGLDDEGLNKMILGVMEQLTNKEILYEPMKELHDKFPKWLEENRTKTKAEDLRRYEEQQKLVKQIVERFERKDYSDENAADRGFIVDRMQQMQAAGSPPPYLVGSMNEALGDIDSGCAQQ